MIYLAFENHKEAILSAWRQDFFDARKQWLLFSKSIGGLKFVSKDHSRPILFHLQRPIEGWEAIEEGLYMPVSEEAISSVMQLPEPENFQLLCNELGLPRITLPITFENQEKDKITKVTKYRVNHYNPGWETGKDRIFVVSSDDRIGQMSGILKRAGIRVFNSLKEAEEKT